MRYTNSAAGCSADVYSATTGFYLRAFHIWIDNVILWMLAVDWNISLEMDLLTEMDGDCFNVSMLLF